MLYRVSVSMARLNLLQQLPAPSYSPCLDSFGHHRQAPIRVLLAFGREIVAENVAGLRNCIQFRF
jgi:hypothetical protein